MKKTKLLTSIAALALVLGLGACEEPVEEEISEDADVTTETDDTTETESDNEEDTAEDFTEEESNEDETKEDNENDSSDPSENDPLEGVDECEVHDFSGVYTDSQDGRHHYQKCAVCGYEEFGVHEADADGTCTACGLTGLNIDGLTYGELQDENDEVVAYYVSKYDVTLTAREVFIPTTHEGLPVTEVGSPNASANSDSVFRVSGTSDVISFPQFVGIPSTVTVINPYAFHSCYSLKEVVLPDSVETIGDYAFYYCYALKTITLNEGLESIGGHALDYCYALRELTIPETVTSLGNYCFQNCSALQKVALPSGLTSLPEYAFDGDYALEEVNIPGEVSSIGQYAFQKCYSITELWIPLSVTTIGGSNFKYTFALTDVYYEGSEEEWNAIEINSSNNNILTSLATIHYNAF